MCLDGWYFNYPEAPFLALILVVIDVRRLTSNKTRMCRLWRPTFGTREAFFRLLVQRYNNLELKTNFSATDFFRGVCKYLTDSALQWYFGNQLLHFDWFWRKWRLVTQNFRKAVIWSWSCSVKIVFGSARSSYNII